MSNRQVKGSDIKATKKDLSNLPKSFSTDDIVRMYCEMKKDMTDMVNRKIPVQTMEKELHNKHKTLALAYPTIFFKTVRGEMDPRMFFSMILPLLTTHQDIIRWLMNMTCLLALTFIVTNIWGGLSF